VRSAPMLEIHHVETLGVAPVPDQDRCMFIHHRRRGMVWSEYRCGRENSRHVVSRPRYALVYRFGRAANHIKNAAYPSGLCAEAVAIGQMVASFGRTPIRAVYIACKGHSPAWPCGTYRQRLNEFAGPSMWVYTSMLADSPQRMTFSELLPNSFGAANLQEIGG